MLPVSKISEFPIFGQLDEICQSLKNSPSRSLILTAETSAGKSTVLPLALLDNFKGKILMTEPRRLAVLGVANRLSELLEENCGQGQIGYKIHLESKVEKNTRLEVVTEAILVRQLQNNPCLENYNLVVLDEFHERSVNTDLALAFVKEAMQLRDDLYLIIMSATINTEKLQKYLSIEDKNVPILKIPGRQFPVYVKYEGEKSLESIIFDELKNSKDGNILVFLPGIGEIKKAYENLINLLNDFDVEILILHSSVSFENQKKVLQKSDKRRIILSSAIAETSLTVPGIKIVIDSGLARVNRINIATGMQNLTTEIESEFSAEQRKGRAGRLEKGKCIRMWSEFNPRVKDFPPEILRVDLSELLLECAERGVYSVEGIDWLDKPVEAAWKEAGKLLVDLGLFDKDGHINEKGKISLTLGLSPRLACIAIEDFLNAGKKSENFKFSPLAKSLLIKYGSYSKASGQIQEKYIFDLEKRLLNARWNGHLESQKIPLVLCGFPDRLAKLMTPLGVELAEYQFPSGRKAFLYKRGEKKWIVAVNVMAGKTQGSIFDYEEISENDVQEFLKLHCIEKYKSRFVDGKVQKSRDLYFGQILLKSTKISSDCQDLLEAWITEVTEKGFDVLPLDEKVENLLLRVEFYHQEKGQREKSSENGIKEYLQKSVQEWLPPFYRGTEKLTSKILYDALFWFLDGEKICKEVPENLILENGKKCKVKYERISDIQPVIEIIIQRIFGCFKTPEICGRKVLLRLLSPAGRPLQITDNLEGFWAGSWVEICKEMKGRYPKHNWDYKIAEKDIN